MELQRLGVMLADALHHELGLRNSLTTPVAGFFVGRTAQDLRAVVAGEKTACEFFPDENAKGLFVHDGCPRLVECGSLARMAKPRSKKTSEPEASGKSSDRSEEHTSELQSHHDLVC